MQDVVERLNQSPMSRTQIIGVVLTMILSALDGYDVLAISFAAPGLSADWNISKAELGLALSSGLVGMAAGSFVLAPLGDRFGRRAIVLACLLLMAGGMFFSAWSRSVVELSFWRVVTGLGIGAMVPTIVPLAAEYSNTRSRRLVMALMSVGYPVGGSIGGFGAALLLSRFSWPSVFILGGILTVLMIVPVALWLREPPQFLIVRRPPGALERLNSYLSQCGQQALSALPDVPENRIKRAPYIIIFSAEHRGQTMLVSLANLLFMMSVYYVLSWMPQLVADLGYSASFATTVSSASATCGVVSCIVAGMIVKRLPLNILAAILLAGLGVSVMAFGFTGGSPLLLLLLACILGAFLYSGVWALYSAIVDSFGPDVRTTGVGFVLGVGRASGAIAPALAGLLFTIGGGRELVTMILASCSIFAAMLIYSSSRHYSF